MKKIERSFSKSCYGNKRIFKDSIRQLWNTKAENFTEIDDWAYNIALYKNSLFQSKELTKKLKKTLHTKWLVKRRITRTAPIIPPVPESNNDAHYSRQQTGITPRLPPEISSSEESILYERQCNGVTPDPPPEVPSNSSYLLGRKSRVVEEIKNTVSMEDCLPDFQNEFLDGNLSQKLKDLNQNRTMMRNRMHLMDEGG